MELRQCTIMSVVSGIWSMMRRSFKSMLIRGVYTIASWEALRVHQCHGVKYKLFGTWNGCRDQHILGSAGSASSPNSDDSAPGGSNPQILWPETCKLFFIGGGCLTLSPSVISPSM